MPGSAAATPTLAADSLLEHERVQDLVHEVHPPSDAHFTIEEIRGNDKLICFYTGFSSYKILLSFFQFLGPAVYELNYWGSKTSVHEPRKRKRLRKISPLNQFFMTLVKLRLNLKILDLAFRFGVSAASASRYITTWICFMYQHLKEVDWMPSIEQVAGTLPPIFQERYPSTRCQ